MELLAFIFHYQIISWLVLRRVGLLYILRCERGARDELPGIRRAFVSKTLRYYCYVTNNRALNSILNRIPTTTYSKIDVNLRAYLP